MSYENAPATELLATTCACCHRDLVDADSIEAGIGPVCRAKYGYGVAAGEPDFALAFAAVASLQGGVDLDTFYASLGFGTGDARLTANRLIHRFARLSDATENDAERLAYVTAISALGYATLANKLAVRVVRDPVRITLEGQFYTVKAPFNEAFNRARQGINGAYFHVGTKRHVVPVSWRKALWNALVECFPKGTVITGPKGVKTL